jgi:hypothetical protein
MVSAKPKTSVRSDPRLLRRRITPGRPQPGLTGEIAACACSEPVRAGLYLLNGDWDAAHRVAQDIAGPLGAHWHALVHRHEPDFPNSKYWLAQVGQSPVYPRLAEAARAAGHETVLRDGSWNAVRFTDRFADPAQAAWTHPLDVLEQEALLDHCMEISQGRAD